VELDPAAHLTNNINSSRKLKVTWFILGRSHTRSSFQLQTPIDTESHPCEGRLSNQTLDRPCVQDRMTPTFCSQSVTESSQEVMFSSALVPLFVC